jgi:hypothetical protein
MTAEQFIWAWIRSELLEPKELHFESVNTYQLLVNAAATKSKSKEVKDNDEINQGAAQEE